MAKRNSWKHQCDCLWGHQVRSRKKWIEELVFFLSPQYNLAFKNMYIYLFMKIRWNLNQIHKLAYFFLSYFLFLSFFLFLSGRFPKFYFWINLLHFLKLMLSCFKFHDLFFSPSLNAPFQCIINCSLSLGLLSFFSSFLSPAESLLPSSTFFLFASQLFLL